MTRKFLLSFILGATMMLGGCATDVQAYKNEKPEMQFDKFFSGPVKASGIVQDRNGKVIKRFEVDMLGDWNGNQGTLDEHFTYSDGKKQHRVWKITKTGPDTFTARADDIKGEAKGRSSGMAIRWNYVMKVETDNGKTYDVTFDDWMFMVGDKALVNRSYMSKFGVRVGELSLFMQKK